MTLPALKADCALAIITPSYAGDLERCRLLCDTLDRFEGNWRHLLLVADGDEPTFRRFAGPRRSVIADSAYLPRWLTPLARPFGMRQRWVSRSITRARLADERLACATDPQAARGAAHRCAALDDGR